MWTVGTSGGVSGSERGYCMMIGSDTNAVQHLDPIFATLAPGIGDIGRTPGRERLDGTAENGCLHCGASGAGHFVKIMNNGIVRHHGCVCGGLNVLRGTNAGKTEHSISAETTPLRDPEHY